MKQRSNDQREIARTLDQQGVEALFRGDYAVARALHEESLKLFQEIDDKSGIEMALNSLGCVTLVEGDFTAAWSFHEASLALARELGNYTIIARSLDNLGLVAFARGDFLTAQTLHVQSLALAQQLGDSPGIAYLMFELAGEAAALGRLRRAVRLTAVAEAQRDALQLSWEPLVHRPFEHALASVRAELTEDAFVEAWAQGLEMTHDEAIAYALGLDDVTAENEVRK
jgi:ATP/maltotriose-dependent transcriptional regulator MalT